MLRLIQRIFQRTVIPVTVLIAVATSCGAAEIDDILEFRGYIRLGGEVQFSIYNKQTQLSEWVRVNEAQDGYTVERFDTATNSLIIRYNDGIGTLSLQASQIARYIPPVPEEAPAAPPSSEELARALRVANPQENSPDPRNRTNQIPAPPSSSAERSRTDNTPSSRMASTGRRAPSPPVAPPLPSPDEEPPDDFDDDDSDEWESAGVPPPMPPISAPDYSPED